MHDQYWQYKHIVVFKTPAVSDFKLALLTVLAVVSQDKRLYSSGCVCQNARGHYG